MSKKNLVTVQLICILFLLMVISCNDSNDQETEKLRKEVSDLKKEKEKNQKDSKTEETKEEQNTEKAEEEPKIDTKKDEVVVPKNNPNIVTAKQVNGTWSYGGNRIKILAMGGGKLKIQLEANDDIYSLGVANIDGTEGTYRPSNDCNLTLSFDAGNLYFSIDGSRGGSSGDCGDFEGRYKKTSSAKPKFDEENFIP